MPRDGLLELELYVQKHILNDFLQLNLTAGEEVEIEYEVDGWFYVSFLSRVDQKLHHVFHHYNMNLALI